MTLQPEADDDTEEEEIQEAKKWMFSSLKDEIKKIIDIR